MSRDWIKMTVGLRTHPKVIRMSSALKADKLRVIGGLFAVWSVFDQHSADGVLIGYTVEAMDGEVGWPGFCAAMVSIGWLTALDDRLVVPDFEEHNSKSAKRRALDAVRKKSARDEDASANGSWNSAGQMSASDADRPGTRVEVEEEKNTSGARRRRAEKANPAGFELFWAAYPRKEAKAKAGEAFRRLSPDSALVAKMLEAIERQRRGQQWQKEGGVYVPHAATWLNQRRWEDGDGSIDGGQGSEGFI